MSDVSAVAPSFNGMAWGYYDECFRRDMTTHGLSFLASAFGICVSDIWSGTPGPLVLPFGTSYETEDVSQNNRSFGKASATSLNKHENAQSPSAHSDMFAQSVMAHIPPVDVDPIPSTRLIAMLAHMGSNLNQSYRIVTIYVRL